MGAHPGSHDGCIPARAISWPGSLRSRRPDSFAYTDATTRRTSRTPDLACGPSLWHVRYELLGGHSLTSTCGVIRAVTLIA
jgi:hypothetical protein